MTDVESGWVILLSLAILASFTVICLFLWLNWWMSGRKQGISPYTGTPLRPVSELAYYSKEKIVHYLHSLQQYDNRIFPLKNSSFCRETGRIFPHSINWLDITKVDWNFLRKRYPGNYISWGSLNDSQQAFIRGLHESLEGFQTDRSSSLPSPRAIEPEFAYAKPGPLYVDIDTNILLGWKVVPGTDLEVLIVQKPIR